MRVCLSLLLAALVGVAPAATAQAPSSLSYQGVLESDGQPVEAPSATLTFRLFDTPTGGSEVWSETKTGVAVEGGVFTTDLGTTTPLGPELFSGPLYLSVAVGGMGAAPLAPRTALRSAPYARTLVAPARIFGDDAGTLLSVQNIASGASGSGIYAETGASAGRAVYGVAASNSGANAGVYGQSESSQGTGVVGTGPAYGVSGQGAIGVDGMGDAIGVRGTGTSYGVYATSPLTAVQAVSERTAIVGRSTGTTGTSVGVVGEASRAGIVGTATGSDGSSTGVSGTGFGFGVRGSSPTFGIYGEATAGSGAAGFFVGRVNVTGMLTKGGGAFQIDHPLAPATRILRHSFVESPDMMNVYNGNATLDAQGEAVVDLPAYFEALNRDFRYQLTALGAPGPNLYIADRVAGNRFRIAGGSPGMGVSWQVTGVRQDAWANENRIVAEEDKPPEQQGRYLHPSAFGRPREQGVDYDAAWEAQRAAMEQARAAREDVSPPVAPLPRNR